MNITLSSLIPTIVILGLVSNYIYGVTDIGYTDDLLVLLIFIIGTIRFLYSKGSFTAYRPLGFSLLVFTTVSLIFLLDDTRSFFYEYYKLMVFLCFVPLLSTIKINTIRNADRNLLYGSGVLLTINLIIIAAQYTISPYVVVKYLMLPVEQIEASTNVGRWVGMFSGINNFGDISILLFLFNEITYTQKKKILRLVFLTSILLSTSKHSIAIAALIVVFLFLKKERNEPLINMIAKRVGLIIGSITLAIIIGGIGYSLNKAAFNSKIEQYSLLVKNISNITENDVRHIEQRAVNIGLGINILKENPLGVGLGVWGDASSKINPNYHPFPQISLSDSSLIHIIVEQGIFSLLYIVMIFSGIKIADINYRWEFIILLGCLFGMSLFTMGLSSGSWPILFAYLYARLLETRRIDFTSRNYENKYKSRRRHAFIEAR